MLPQKPKREEAHNAVKFIDALFARLDMGGLKPQEVMGLVHALQTLAAFTSPDAAVQVPAPAPAAEKAAKK
jgi:hypothetical protein